ncbi:methyl-accepting chemotaxis protein [Gammaproteobacteria bacterium AS21]
MKSIRAKVFALVIIPLILVVITLSSIAINGLNNMGESQVTLYKEQLFKLKKDELSAYTEIAKKSVADLSPDKQGDLELLRNRIRDLKFGSNSYFFVFDKKSNTIVHAGNPKLEGKNLSAVKDARGDLVIQKLVQIAVDGGGFLEYYWENPATKSEDLKISFSSMLEQWDYMIGIGVYVDDIDKKVAYMKTQSDQQMTSLLTNNIVVSAGIMLLSICLVLFAAPRITRPLLFVAESLEQIAKGDGDLTQRIDIKSKDEAGRVAVAFNQFVDMIQGLVSEIRESTKQLNNTMMELESLRQKNTVRAQEQIKHRENVVQGISELMTSATDISDNSTKATEQAKNATLEAEQGINGLHENNTQIKQLAADIRQASQVISELENEVSSIGTVLNVIQEIAEQTNLLALNAAIEAARAGDQGRGFAVVADEVRALAARTRNSTEEIQNMIQRLESKSQSAVSVMNESQTRSIATADHASTVIERLSHLNSLIAQINVLNNDIDSTSHLQSTMTEKMSGDIQLISTLGKESFEDDKVSAEHSKSVAEQSNRVYNLVGQFKV